MCNDRDARCETEMHSQPAHDTLAERTDDLNVPLLSVIVLCYKNSALLKGMLDSIFRQNYQRIQLIVSDDGSDDFNVEAVTEYIEKNKEANITQAIVRKNEENQCTVQHIIGVLPLAEGEYIVFTAADDRFNDDNAFSSYVKSFEQEPEKLWLVARCNLLTPDYKRSLYVTPTEADAPYFEKGDSLRLFSRWSRRGMSVPCSMAFRREAFEAVGGIDSEYRYLEDWPLVLKLLRKGYAPIYMPHVTAVHSVGGVTNSNKRYGVNVREAFYKDKQLIFRKEVEPYLNLLTQEDLTAYKLYQKEIMARSFFLDITWTRASRLGKLKLMLKPQQLWWIAEKAFMKYKHIFQRKRMFIISQLLLLASLPLYIVGQMMPMHVLFCCIGVLDMIVSMCIFCAAVISFPLKLIFEKQDKMRKELVN